MHSRVVPWFAILSIGTAVILLVGCPGDDDAGDDDAADDDASDDDTGDDDSSDDDTSDDDTGDDDTAPAMVLDQTEYCAGHMGHVTGHFENFAPTMGFPCCYDESVLAYRGTYAMTRAQFDMFFRFSLVADGTYTLGQQQDLDVVRLQGDLTSVGNSGDEFTGDHDLYTFEVESDSYVTAWLDWPDAKSDYDLMLFDVTNSPADTTNWSNMIMSFGATQQNPELIGGVLLSDHDYAALVVGWDGNPGTYELTLAFANAT